MRIMQVVAPHPEYLHIFQERNKQKRRYVDILQAYMDDFYWGGHTLVPALARLGNETCLCIPEDALSQSCWCHENHIPLRLLEEDYLAVCAEQIRRFQPDVLYLSCASLHNDNLLSRLSFRPKLVIAWHATHTWTGMHLSGIDLMLSSHKECLQLARHQGAREGAYFYPGFPAELSHRFSPNKHSDLCFAGFWSISHLRRNALLTELAQRISQRETVRCVYHITVHPGPLTPPCPEEVQRCNHGSVWGLALYKAFASSRIVLNSYCLLNGGRPNLSPNMRQLESTGVGSFLLTENSPNLKAFFTPNVDLVTFSDADEMIDKARYYLSHEDERQIVAAHGQASCLRQFNMDIRARAFMHNVRRLLETPPVPDETRLRVLRNIADASRDNPALVNEPDVVSIIATTLETIPARLERGGDLVAESLLRSVEALPVGTFRNLDFCRAMHCLATGDAARAECLLARELEAYPENDAARHCFSDLLLQRTLNADADPSLKR